MTAHGENDVTPFQRGRGYRVLFGALLLLLGLLTVEQRTVWAPITLSLVGGVALLVTLWSLDRRPAVFWTGACLLVPAVAGGVLSSEDAAVGLGGSPFHAPFLFFVAGSVLVSVLRAERVGEDTLLGAVCAYLLLGVAFASAYEAVEFFVPGAIAGLDADSAYSVFSQLSYFSLVTLTTLGYGDLSPVHPFAQSIAIVESVVGTMFPALVVGRIVGVWASASESPLRWPEPRDTPEARVARILFFMLPATALLIPWLERGPFGGHGVGAVVLLVVLSGVYFVSGRRVVLVVGSGLAFISFALQTLGGRLFQVGLFLDLVLLAGVIAIMGVWSFRQRRATTSILLISVCLYWLLGIAFATLFELIERIDPRAIGSPEEAAFAPMLYFSFMTLTTTGYGDWVPVTAICRALAGVEAFLGVFYPAIVIAKLVSLYGSQAANERV